MKILLLLVCVIVSVQAWAVNGFSYVYIQGDKATPFYVKFEDQMLPRFGKNYSIIPQLVPGAINIQILFQQNVYPPQKFTVVVPENGFRGFLLLQKNGTFSLYDVHQQFYLYPGNKAEDDRVAPHNNNNTYVYTSEVSKETKQAVNTTPAKQETVSLKFLPNVELSSDHRVQNNSQGSRINIAQEPAVEEAPYNEEPTEPMKNDNPSPELVADNTYVTNSDCPFAIKNEEFEDFYDKVASKNEKSKLKFLLTKVTECYTTNQARILAETLNNDPERYTFLKRVYPRITDQYNFAMLENLLSTQEWKSYFNLILPK